MMRPILHERAAAIETRGRKSSRCRSRCGSLGAVSLAAALLQLTGCQGDRLQSSLHPASPAASAIAQLWWILLAVLGVYTVAVFILTLIAIFKRPRDERPSRYQGRAFILIGGVILPSLILVPLLIYSLTTTSSLRMPETGLTIRVVGYRWWWDVDYPEQSIRTANELYIPVGEPVRLEMTSGDVIHSFWVPRLHGKMDMLPGQTTTFWIEADRPGTFRGQCAEFCGVQHARMAFTVEALPPEEFARWVANQQRASGQQQSPPASPTGAGAVPGESPDGGSAGGEANGTAGEASADAARVTEVASGEVAAGNAGAGDAGTGDAGTGDAGGDPPSAGEQAFFRHGCAVCHAIRGTRAVGRAGPDLTYIGSRPTLGAATVPNTPENLLRWVTNPQPIKPGINMPPTHASAEEIEAIVGYLRSLQYEGDQE